jgi:two-component system, sensor histidine kinase and response regulator
MDVEKKNPTILIVDDNPNNIKVLAIILTPFNYKIVIATDGAGAVEMVDRVRPDLILLDIMMPVMDGYEACRIIKSKKENTNIPVLFLSALDEKESIVEGFEAGGVDYITKPFNKEELFSRIRTHLELKLARDEIEKSNNHLTDLNSMKDKILSVIGHDLRDPVSSLKMTLDYLGQANLKSCDDFLNYIETMSFTVNEVFSLLENLLGWAKSQSGNVVINPEIIKLNDLIQSVYRLQRSSIQNKKIFFENLVDQDIRVFTDFNSIYTVIRNLISNAIKFTPVEGSIFLEAETRESTVLLKIRDTGVGIPSENLSKLFDSKKHFTTYGTNNESGSGLGLVLCKNYVEMNGGTIEVESEVNKGTTFFIALPLRETPDLQKE